MLHTLLTKGELHPQYQRAIKSFEVHGEDVCLWYCDQKPDTKLCRVARYVVPFWLQDQLGCVIYDYAAYDLLHRLGGIILGLDSHSVAPALDLLGDHEVVFSRDVPDDVEIPHPYNNNMIGQPETEAAQDMVIEAKCRILKGNMAWGDTGPAMLTQFVEKYPGKVAGVPFPALTGWGGDSIWKFYTGAEEPHSNTRNIHLFSSAYPELFWDESVELWIAHNPDFAWVRDYARAYPKVDPEIWR